MSSRLLVLPLLLAASAAAAEADPPMPPNAALKYWQAWALLPKDADQPRFDALVADPHARSTAAWVKSCHDAFTLLHEGAAIRRCEWGWNPEGGLYVPLPHLGKMRQLARAACAVARVDFENKNYPEATERILDVFALSRHVGSGLLIGKLVEVAIARMAADALVLYLPKLPPETLKELSERLAKLPPSATCAEVIRADQEALLGWLRKEISTKPARERPNLWKDLWLALGGDPPLGSELMRKLLGDDVMLAGMLNDLEQHYADFIAAVSRPAREQEAALAEVEVKLKTASPFVRLIFPLLNKCQRTMAENEVRMAMLRAALDVAAGGPDGITRSKDPYGEGPFGYKKLDVGFELTSKLISRDGAPVKLLVGVPPPAPAPGPEEAILPPRLPGDNPGDF